MSNLRTLQSSDFDHQLSVIEAQVYALNESLARLKELKKNMKSGTFELPLTRQELAKAMGRTPGTVDNWSRKGRIKGHLIGSTRLYYLSEVEAAIKKS